MAPETPLHQIGQVLERLLDEPDPGRRERLLAHCIFDAGLAHAVVMYAEDGTWQPLISCGPADALPDASLVASVADGEIGPELPPDRLVIVAGDRPRRRALVVAGGLGDEYRLDFFEAVLTVLSCLDSVDDPEAPLSDRVLPPFQRAAVESRPATAPNPDLAEDLRSLLFSIRSRQDELDLSDEQLDDGERELLAELMESECQLAGDLLIEAFADDPDPDPFGDSESAVASSGPEHEKSRWRRVFEEIAGAHTDFFGERGTQLRSAVVEPGELELRASEGDYRIALETLLELARIGGASKETAEDAVIRLSLHPQELDDASGLALNIEFTGVTGPETETRLARLRTLVDGRAGYIDQAVSAQDAVRISVWFPVLSR